MHGGVAPPPAVTAAPAPTPAPAAPIADAEANPEMADAERALEAMTNFRLAETALQRGDMAQAEKLAQKAAEGDPDQGEYVALHAWVKAMGATPNQVTSAIETISSVLKGDPTCERALLYRGKLYKRANKTKEALKDFEAVLKINPKHREAASEVRLLKMHTK
jgi:tetratricopeptide (TPR) repeat protein